MKQRTANKLFAKAGLTGVVKHLYFYQHLCKCHVGVFQMPCLHTYENR